MRIAHLGLLAYIFICSFFVSGLNAATYTGTISLSGTVFNTGWSQFTLWPRTLTGVTDSTNYACFTKFNGSIIQLRIQSIVPTFNNTGSSVTFRLYQSWTTTTTLTSSHFISYVCSDSYGLLWATGATGNTGAVGATGSTWATGAIWATGTTTIITQLATWAISLTGISLSVTSESNTGYSLDASGTYFELFQEANGVTIINYNSIAWLVVLLTVGIILVFLLIRFFLSVLWFKRYL